MIPQTHTRFVARGPHGLIVLTVMVSFFIALMADMSDADAQRRKRRRRGKRKPPPAKKAPPTADADTPRSGPASATESDLADPAADPDAAPATDKSVGSADATVRKKGKNVQEFDFTGMSLFGSERKPQLLYFLERANEELERASLERRSFVPEMVRSLEEEAL